MIYFTLFYSFFLIGAFTFGGGYAMLPMVQDTVSSHEWLTVDKIIDFIAVSESTPGPFAVNISTYVGVETGGFLGSVCATLGVILPSFIIILVIAQFFEKFKNNSVVSGCMSGLRPAVVGLIGTAVVSTGMTVFFPSKMPMPQHMPFHSGLFTPAVLCFAESLVIFVPSLILALKKIHPILIIVGSAIAGIIIGYVFKI